MSRDNHLSSLMLKIVGCIFVLTILMSFNLSLSLFVLGSLNSIICIFSIFSYEKNYYTLHKVTNIFILLFFVVANLQQFSQGSIVSSVYVVLSEDDFIAFQCIVFIILLLYNGLYRHCYLTPNNWTTEDCEIKPSYRRLIFASVISLGITLLYFRGNFIHLFFRGVEDDMMVAHAEQNVANDLIFDKVVRPIPFACFIISKLYGDNKKSFFILVITLLALFPTSLSRNAVAMYWLPILILLFSKFFNNSHFFSISLLFSLLIVFPFFDNFRYFTGDVTWTINWNYMNSMNFDSSQEMMIAIKWHLVTWGNQLLGVLFFWVPRSIWHSKPIGSGAFLASGQGAFSNISMPFWGEGYINFGYIGIILFTIILSFSTAKFDNRIWESKNSSSMTGYYLILIGALIFILRGDLLSSTAYTVGTLLSLRLVHKYCTR